MVFHCVLTPTYSLTRSPFADTLAKRDPWLRQFFDIAFTINKWYPYKYGHRFFFCVVALKGSIVAAF